MWLDGTDVEDPSIWILPPHDLGSNCGSISDVDKQNTNTKYKKILHLISCTELAESYICHKSKLYRSKL